MARLVNSATTSKLPEMVSTPLSSGMTGLLTTGRRQHQNHRDFQHPSVKALLEVLDQKVLEEELPP